MFLFLIYNINLIILFIIWKKIYFVYTLTHKFKDDTFNLNEQLYKNQIVDKKIFCFKHYGISTGEIFFGDLSIKIQIKLILILFMVNIIWF